MIFSLRHSLLLVRYSAVQSAYGRSVMLEIYPFWQVGVYSGAVLTRVAESVEEGPSNG